MQKKIEDYLHLYLGCRFVLKIKMTGKYSSPMILSCDALGAAIDNSADKIYPVLLLRSLDSMTEDEKNELTAISNGIYPAMFSIKERIYLPEEFIWLLSKRFDLFGLIESGLALNEKDCK